MFAYEQYTCPRCGYQTKEKSNIRNHFYKKKKPCPGIKLPDLIITDDIKEHVLTNRTYIHDSIQPHSSQHLVNYIKSLGIQPKHALWEEHVVTKDFVTSIEEKYEVQTQHYDDGNEGIDLDKNDLLASIGKAVKAETKEDLNAFHDGSMIWLKKDQILNEINVVIGVKEIIKMIYDSYWMKYECYLASQHYKATCPRVKAVFYELLEMYYNFLICLGLPPYSKTAENGYLIDKLLCNEDTDVAREYYKIYEKTAKNVKQSDISKMQREVKQIIISECKSNKKELNKAILDLVKKDPIFKNKLLSLQ